MSNYIWRKEEIQLLYTIKTERPQPIGKNMLVKKSQQLIIVFIQFYNNKQMKTQIRPWKGRQKQNKDYRNFRTVQNGKQINLDHFLQINKPLNQSLHEKSDENVNKINISTKQSDPDQIFDNSETKQKVKKLRIKNLGRKYSLQKANWFSNEDLGNSQIFKSESGNRVPEKLQKELNVQQNKKLLQKIIPFLSENVFQIKKEEEEEEILSEEESPIRRKKVRFQEIKNQVQVLIRASREKRPQDHQLLRFQNNKSYYYRKCQRVYQKIALDRDLFYKKNIPKPQQIIQDVFQNKFYKSKMMMYENIINRRISLDGKQKKHDQKFVQLEEPPEIVLKNERMRIPKRLIKVLDTQNQIIEKQKKAQMSKENIRLLQIQLNKTMWMLGRRQKIGQSPVLKTKSLQKKQTI